MKALVLLLLLPAMMLIGCGKMDTAQTTAGSALQQLNDDGAINDADLAELDSDLLNENLEVSEASPDSILMKLGGAEFLVSFIEELSGDPKQTAMIINGIEVAQEVVSNPDSFQSLMASLVASQLEDVDVLGIPVADLIDVGKQIISGDRDSFNFSKLFGTLIRGTLNKFLSGSPVGELIRLFAGPLLGLDKDDVGADSGQQDNSGTSQDNNNSNNSNDTNNSGSGVGGTIVNAIGSVIAGGNPLLGGLFNLISNLIK